MKYIDTKNDLIEIIMPPLIGDCIMVFPIINFLKLQYNVTLSCNEYVYSVVNFLQHPLKSKKLLVDNIKNKIIIDFLSNDLTATYIKNHKTKLTVGFKDGYWEYDLFLKQPSEFNKLPASSIFLYALEVMGIDSAVNLDFSCSKKWQSDNQTKILIAPGAGNISRCYSIDDFILISNYLNNKNIAFILGPNDKSIRSLIPLKFEIIETDDIENTISILSKSRVIIASEGGFMHIAASFGIPLVGLFKFASIKNWFPYNYKNQYAFGHESNDYTSNKIIRLKVSEIENIVNKINSIITNENDS
jgi:ADP-heptose:LPS heptosyltransferase